MKSLRDVLPMGTTTVILRKNLPEDQKIAVDVRGIDIGDFGPLFVHFPEIVEALNGGKLDAASLIKTLPAKAVSALIAAGAGILGDEEAEAGITNLALFEKLALLVPVLQKTMPDGPRPLVELLVAMGVLEEGALSAFENAGKSKNLPPQHKQKKREQVSPTP